MLTYPLGLGGAAKGKRSRQPQSSFGRAVWTEASAGVCAPPATWTQRGGQVKQRQQPPAEDHCRPRGVAGIRMSAAAPGTAGVALAQAGRYLLVFMHLNF